MTFSFITRRAILGIGAAALFLTACGGGGYGGDSGQVAPPPVVLETVTATLDGDQEVPARATTAATGTASFQLDRAGRTLSGTVTVDGVVPTAAHIHLGAAGSSGAVAIALSVSPGGAVTLPATVLTMDQLASLDAGALYVNIHSAAHPTGEIRGQIGREVYVARLSGAQETTPVSSTARGTGFVVLDPATRAIRGELEISGMTATAAHIHSGVLGINGAVVLALEDHGGHGHYTVPANTVLTAAQVDALRAGGLYFNVHSAAQAGGEIRGQIGRRVLVAAATGAQEVPANASAATGRALLAYDPRTRTLEGSLGISGMTATIAHVHQAAAGVNGPVAVALAETAPGSGTWSVPAATVLSVAQAQALLADGTYVNAHSAAFATGEIRGQLALQ